jgi:hypothetical protein
VPPADDNSAATKLPRLLTVLATPLPRTTAALAPQLAEALPLLAAVLADHERRLKRESLRGIAAELDALANRSA